MLSKVVDRLNIVRYFLFSRANAYGAGSFAVFSRHVKFADSHKTVGLQVAQGADKKFGGANDRQSHSADDFADGFWHQVSCDVVENRVHKGVQLQEFITLSPPDSGI